MLDQQDIYNAQILIVDDIEANVALLEQILRDNGYQHITSTMDPYAVVNLHRANSYDLILLDLQMPGMDGLQVIDEIRKAEANKLPSIMVITAQVENKRLAMTAGAKGFIGKPFDLAEVENSIKTMLKETLWEKVKQQTKIVLGCS